MMTDLPTCNLLQPSKCHNSLHHKIFRIIINERNVKLKKGRTLTEDKRKDNGQKEPKGRKIFQGQDEYGRVYKMTV